MATRKRQPTDAQIAREFAESLAREIDAKFARTVRKATRKASADVDAAIEREFKVAMDAELRAELRRRAIQKRFDDTVRAEEQLAALHLKQKLETAERFRQRELAEADDEFESDEIEFIDEPDFPPDAGDEVDFDDYWDDVDLDVGDADDEDSGGNGSTTGGP